MRFFRRRVLKKNYLSVLSIVIAGTVSVGANADTSKLGDVEAMSLYQLEQLERMMAPPPLTFEEMCRDATEEDEEDGHASRTFYCVKRVSTYTSHNSTTGEDEEAEITVYNYAQMPRLGQDWDNWLRIDVSAVKGNAANGLTIAPEMYCGSCTKMEQFSPKTLSGPGRYDFTSRMELVSENGETGQNVQVVLSRFNSDETLLPISAPRLRCDSVANASPGCRFNKVPAIFTLSISNPDVDEMAFHTRDAQAAIAGRPGYFDPDPSLRGKPLTRLTDGALAEKNRKVSVKYCPERFPDGKPEKHDCDEFPYASTYQGGAMVTPEEISVRYISQGQNRRAGALLQNFYAYDARLFDGEEFWVYVTE